MERARLNFALDCKSPWRLASLLGTYVALTIAMYWWPGYEGNIPQVWLADAFMVAMLLRGVIRSLPMGLLLTLAGSTISNLAMHTTWLPAVAFGAADMSEVAAAILCARAVGLRMGDPIDDRFFMKAFLALIAVGPAVAAVLGATAMYGLLGRDWTLSYSHWLVGDGMGMLLLLPPLLSYSSKQLHALRWGQTAIRFWFTALLSIGITLLSVMLFNHPFILLSIPLLFAAYRLGVFGTSVACTANVMAIFALAIAGQRGWPIPLYGIDELDAQGIAFYSTVMVIGPLLIAVVIAQRKRLGNQLAEVSAQLRVVADNIPALVGQLDAQLRYCFVNSKYLDFYGKPEQEILGKTPHELLGADLLQQMDPHFVQVLAGIPQRFVLSVAQDKRFEVSFEPQRRQDGPVVGFFVLAQDITDRLELESRLHEITENVPALIAYQDHDLVYRFANARYAELWGSAADKLSGLTLAEVVEDRYSSIIMPMQLTCLQGSHVGQELYLDDGRVIEMTYVPHLLEGSVRGIYTLGIDVSARKQAEALLFEAMDKSKMMLDSIGDAVVACGVDMRITMMNPVAAVMSGWREEQAIGKPFDEVVQLIDLESGNVAQNPLEVAIREDRVVALQLNSKLLRKDGTETAVEDSAAPIHNREGKVIGGIMVLHDVSETRLMAMKMSHLAQHDHLTDLPNRVLLHDRLSLALTRLLPEQKGAVLFIDLDHFKNINDSLGHSAGDLVLKQVATRLRGMVRADDTVSRQGGDEFVILLSRLGDVGDAARIAEKIITAIEQPFMIDQRELHVSATIGIAIYPEDSIEVKTLMKQADTALYHAKQGGRGGFSYFTRSMSERAEQRLAMEHALRNGINNNELFLLYQPKFRLPGRRLIGVEALVRWRQPDGSVIMPDQFITLAEETGLITHVDAWVMQEACRQLRAWEARDLVPVPVSVNVSLARLDMNRLPHAVDDALHSTGIAPRLLEIEFTESQMFTHQDQARVLLGKLKSLGVRFAIDDFGTGYSSLNYLAQYEFDTIKIDRSFVTDLPSRPRNQAIVQAIVGMAHALGHDLIAEGVETQLEADTLLAYGCKDMQGYLFGRPMPADAFQTLLQRPPP